MYNWKTVLITIVALVGVKIWSPYIVDNVRWSYFDFLHQSKEKVIVEDILLVNIDEKAIEKYGQYPFPRNVYADVLWETHHSNTHVFNILFAEEDRFGGDEVFANALENRLTILSSAPTIQTASGNAPFVNTSVFGDGDIIKNHVNSAGLSYPLGYNHFSNTQYLGNKRMIVNALNYILENDNIINIRSKEINLRLLNKKEIKENKLKWQLINTLLPIFIISVIISLLLLRRKRKYR